MKVARAGGLTAAGGLTLAAALVCMAVSAMALGRFGVPYDTAGGSSLAKVHPSTWMFALALAARAAAQTDPMAWIAGLPRRFPGAAIFAPTLALTIAFGVVVQHSPATALVDTFFGGLAMLVLHEDLNVFERRMLRDGAHAFMALNALVGLGEYFGHFRLTPFVAAGVEITDDVRSTALLGHPLANAAATGIYVATLVLSSRWRAAPTRRIALIALQMAAMVAFGGRTAFVLTAILLGAKLAFALFSVIAGRRFALRDAALAALLAPMAILVLYMALDQGLASSFIDRFLDDKGSADARFAALDLFGSFSTQDILFGPDPGMLADRQRTFGIEYGIENSWLGLVLEYGALMASMLIAGFLALLADFARRAQPGVGYIIVMLLILASSAASLSVKSLLFPQFAILLLAVFSSPAPARVAPARATPRPSARPQAAWS